MRRCSVLHLHPPGRDNDERCWRWGNGQDQLLSEHCAADAERAAALGGLQQLALARHLSLICQARALLVERGGPLA